MIFTHDKEQKQKGKRATKQSVIKTQHAHKYLLQLTN